MAPRYSVIVLLAALLGQQAAGQDAAPADEASPAEGEAGDGGEYPHGDEGLFALLEFLGEFETEDGVWIDPADLMAMEGLDRRTDRQGSEDDDDE